jgi:hypothetical protein
LILRWEQSNTDSAPGTSRPVLAKSSPRHPASRLRGPSRGNRRSKISPADLSRVGRTIGAGDAERMFRIAIDLHRLTANGDLPRVLDPRERIARRRARISDARVSEDRRGRGLPSSSPSARGPSTRCQRGRGTSFSVCVSAGSTVQARRLLRPSGSMHTAWTQGYQGVARKNARANGNGAALARIAG